MSCYPGFLGTSASDVDQMSSDIHFSLTEICAYEVTVAVRCSKCLVVEQIAGPGVGSKGGTNMRDVPVLTSHGTLHVKYRITGDLPEEDSDAYVQVSVLHTNLNQQRIVRVLNHAMPLTSTLSSVFRYADVHSVCRSMLLKACEATATEKLPVICSKMQTDCVEILYSYRQHCASNHSSGQVGPLS